jgi:hypothetical protein
MKKLWSEVPGAGAALALAGAVLAATPCPAQTAADDVVRVEVTGTLQTGIAAIGGETTGTLIRSGGVTWELDLRGDPAMTAAAAKLNGRRVVVTGTLTSRPGVEVPRRDIVVVTALRPANGAGAREGR